MEKTYKDCEPTICGRDSLMSKDGEFRTKDIIKAKCDCFCSSVCLQICDLLASNHWPEGVNLLPHTRKQNGG